ncbi:MAG: DNA-processing protein DprA [Streptococcaceae bacterium]|nr:DNA-processing protein DprA [Streptococcaceae bacterium]
MQFGRDLLFKLKFIKGISNQQINTFIKKVQELELHNHPLTHFDIVNLAGIDKTRFSFLKNWSDFTHEQLQKAQKEHHFISILDEDYPYLLKEIHNPPVILFYKGNKQLLQTPMLSVVGSRDASELGIKSIQTIIQPIATSFTFVSGLATGIDGSAHKLVLKHGGNTIGVIGTGLDVCYPKHHESLQEYMSQKQLVLSEYPNGTTPKKHHFPQRNRIIAGLSYGTIVIEAKIRSGSLITCERALESGREIFAVPGEIISGRFEGCHKLIQQGAKCTTSYKDILQELISIA